MMNPLNFLWLCAVISLLVIASNMAFDDEVAEQERYCEMVNSGAWPNYDNIDCRLTK